MKIVTFSIFAVVSLWLLTTVFSVLLGFEFGIQYISRMESEAVKRDLLTVNSKMQNPVLREYLKTKHYYWLCGYQSVTLGS
jgi:hypothetical protein